MNSASAVESIPCVLGYFSAKDIPKNGTNIIGPIAHDEEIFATEYVTCVGQVIGVVVAETRALALRAAAAVDVQSGVTHRVRGGASEAEVSGMHRPTTSSVKKM